MNTFHIIFHGNLTAPAKTLIVLFFDLDHVLPHLDSMFTSSRACFVFSLSSHNSQCHPLFLLRSRPATCSLLLQRTRLLGLCLSYVARVDVVTKNMSCVVLLDRGRRRTQDIVPLCVFLSCMCPRYISQLGSKHSSTFV